MFVVSQSGQDFQSVYFEFLELFRNYLEQGSLIRSWYLSVYCGGSEYNLAYLSVCF